MLNRVLALSLSQDGFLVAFRSLLEAVVLSQQDLILLLRVFEVPPELYLFAVGQRRLLDLRRLVRDLADTQPLDAVLEVDLRAAALLALGDERLDQSGVLVDHLVGDRLLG